MRAASCRLLRAGCFVPAASCRPLRAGCFVPAASCRPLRAGCFVPAASCRLLRAGRFVPAASCRLLRAGRFVPAASCRLLRAEPGARTSRVQATAGPRLCTRATRPAPGNAARVPARAPSIRGDASLVVLGSFGLVLRSSGFCRSVRQRAYCFEGSRVSGPRATADPSFRVISPRTVGPHGWRPGGLLTQGVADPGIADPGIADPRYCRPEILQTRDIADPEDC